MGDWAYDPGEASHRALREIREELMRHPAVTEVQAFPTSTTDTSLTAQIAPDRLGGDPGNATLTVRWFAGETPDARPEFSFHYHSPNWGNFGWHHEPNPHVDGWGHFQEAAVMEYDYRPYDFGTLIPSRVVWEILSRLEERFESE